MFDPKRVEQWLLNEFLTIFAVNNRQTDFFLKRKQFEGPYQHGEVDELFSLTLYLT